MKTPLLLIIIFAVSFNSPLFAKEKEYDFYNFVADRDLYPTDHAEKVIERYSAFLKREIKRLKKEDDKGSIFPRTKFLEYSLEEDRLGKSLNELQECTKVHQLVEDPSFSERHQRARLLWYKESCDAAFKSGIEVRLFSYFDLKEIQLEKRFPIGKAFDKYRNKPKITALYPNLDLILSGDEHIDDIFDQWFLSYTQQAYIDFLTKNMSSYGMLIMESVLMDEARNHIGHLQNCITSRQLLTAPNQAIFNEKDKNMIRSAWQHCVDKHQGEKYTKQITEYPYDLLEQKYGQDVTKTLGIKK